jgi:hypothetical protein
MRSSDDLPRAVGCALEGISDMGFDIFRFNGSAFEQVPGALVVVAVGSDGTVWGLGNPYQ